MPDDSLIKLPINATVSANYNNSNTTITYDSHVFPPETNKTVKLGTIIKRNALVKCLGNGKIDITMIEDPIEKLKKLADLKDKGIITLEQFEQKRTELLDKIC